VANSKSAPGESAGLGECLKVVRWGLTLSMKRISNRIGSGKEKKASLRARKAGPILSDQSPMSPVVSIHQ